MAYVDSVKEKKITRDEYGWSREIASKCHIFAQKAKENKGMGYGLSGEGI